MSEQLSRAITYFTEKSGIMSELCIACGTGERVTDAYSAGIGPETVFDLASVTKLFTGLTILRLRDEGLLSLEMKVTDAAPRFTGLTDVTVGQLMAFGVELRTPGRIDACSDRASALQCLYGTKAIGTPGKRPYSDIPAMILKYIAEGVCGEPFFEIVRRRVLIPAGMRETWSKVPAHRLADCLNYSGEHRIEKGKRILREGPATGIPHDPKAGILCGTDGDLCGHAGLFSTLPDMVRFCRAVLDGSIVSRKTLAEMAVNRTGHRMEDGTYRQYLGYQCYVKHPDQYYSEIPAYMSGSAVGIAGFTGNHLSVDPEKGIFAIFLGNRVKDRLTVLIPDEGKCWKDYGLEDDGPGMFRWDEHTVIQSSVNYVHRKDEHLHTEICEILKEYAL